MIILGLLLILGIGGLSLAAATANDGVFTAPAGAIELFGAQLSLTVGQLVLLSAAAGAMVLLGLMMIVNGMGRKARRRSDGRHQLRDHRQEMQDLQRNHDAATSDVAADSDGVTARR